MASCAACGTTILFGGKRDGSLQFCGANCLQRGHLVRVAQQIPPDVIARNASAIFRGQCPKCKGPGPIDVFTSYRVWSALLLTSWRSRPEISCRGCGRRRQALDAMFCAILGWWGIPYGLVITPLQLGRNIHGMFAHASEHEPSQRLYRATAMILASQAIQASVSAQK